MWPVLTCTVGRRSKASFRLKRIPARHALPTTTRHAIGALERVSASNQHVSEHGVRAFGAMFGSLAAFLHLRPSSHSYPMKSRFLILGSLVMTMSLVGCQ